MLKYSLRGGKIMGNSAGFELFVVLFFTAVAIVCFGLGIFQVTKRGLRDPSVFWAMFLLGLVFCGFTYMAYTSMDTLKVFAGK
jgi:hypothetical protein